MDENPEYKILNLTISTKCFALVEKLNCKGQEQKHFIFSWTTENTEESGEICISEQVQITPTEIP
jgi:hypothetical protein